MTSELDNTASSDQKDSSHKDIDDILTTIQANLISNKEQAVTKAVDDFELVLHKYNETIPGKIFKWTKKNSNVNVRALITQKLQDQITRVVKDNSLKLPTIIPVDDTEIDYEYVVKILMEAINSLSDEIIKKLLCSCVIPEMFNTVNKDQQSHDVIINFGFQLIIKFPINKLSTQEVKLFTTQLIEQHIKVLEKWREENFSRWHELWMFLVRFSAKHLHTAMDLANKLLRIVEFAFRNSSYEQRLKGYECWKELIDNASLDMKHMCSSKQIRLLITPLRAKFSKMEVVICKRFEVFLYLLEKMQSNSVLCLNEFLEFCFGVSNTNSSSKNGQGKLVPNLWLRSIQVFLAILGDQTHISTELKRTIFQKPIINESNINRFDQVIVYSVIESSTILKIISINDAEKISILVSLWKALFSILIKSSKEVQEKCFQMIFSSLDALFKDYNEDLAYLSLLNAFAELVDSTIDYSVYSECFNLLIEHSIKFLNEGVVSEDLLDQFEKPFVKLCEEKRLFEFLTEQLKNLDPSKNEVVIYELWKILGREMINGNKSQSKLAPIILSWPILHLQKCSMLSDDICTKWRYFFSQIWSSNKIIVINEIDKIFKSNPLLSSNISTIMSALGKDDVNLEESIIEPLLKLMANVMSLPLLSQESSEKLFFLILKCTKVFIASDDITIENVDNICQCLQKVPAHLKDCDLLQTIENLVKKLVPYTNINIVKKLRSVMTIFSNTNLQKKALKISTLLSPEPSTSSPVGVKRSIRMTQMVFDKNGSTPNKDKVDALQLFGKDVETLTPLKVKGSILQSTAPSSSSRSKRIINSVKKPHIPEPPTFDDQSTSDFVVINTEVKLQKDKLTDHQKEKLKQRREDIPALYQDLSQSQTQSSLSIDTQSDSTAHEVQKNEDNETVSRFSEKESSSSSFMDQKLEITVEENAIVKTIEQLKKHEETDTNTDSSDERSTKKTRRYTPKSERELLRIQMDIVGGNTFIQNLPSKRPRKVNDKISSTTTKRSRKSESDTQIMEKSINSTVEPMEIDISSAARDSEQNESNKSSDVASSKNNLSPMNNSIVLVEDFQLIKSPSNTNSSGESSSQNTPNRRKNKFMKPIKNFGSPSSEKRHNKSENKETLSARKKKKDIKEEKSTRKQTLPSKEKLSEAPQSEILFESQINKPLEEKSPNNTPKPKKSLNASTSDQESEISSEENGIKVKKEDQVVKNTVGRSKKSPKELMKKNKEKVKTIQSQLKLANLNDLEGSSEKNKPKNAKLIFIRELTNLKNSQDPQVSPAGLKRNKDNKSKSVAYTIETPSTSVKISSLDLNIDDMQPSTSKSSPLKDNMGKEKVKSVRKRKRSNSVSENSLSNETSPESERKSKISKLMPIKVEEDVKEIEKPTNPNMYKTKSMEKRICVKETNSEDDPPSESSELPKSPSRSTRSRTNSPVKKTDDSLQREETPRGVRSLFKESEDIIESSQGSFVENSSMSIGNMSKSKIKQSPKLQNCSVKSQDTIKEETASETKTDTSQNMSGIEELQEVKIEKPISQADTLTCESNYEAQPLVVQVETQEKHELSDSEKLLSMADTVSIESCLTEEMAKTENKQENNPVKDMILEKSDKQSSEISDTMMTEENNVTDSSPVSNEMTIESFGTPQKNKDNLPGSPVSQATPTFKKELLDSTFDISPIGSQNIDVDDKMGRDILEALDAAIAEGSTGNEVEQGTSSSKCSEENKVTISSNERSNKLLNMVNVESPVSSLKKTSKKKTATPVQMKTRYEKLFSIYANKENGDEAKENSSVTCTENAEDLLTFSREVPSPLAVPSSSILKRKLADTDDSYSPCPKRKRVNFSYPCITSTKLFIRHKDELNTHYKPTYGANLFDDVPEEEVVNEEDEEDPFEDPELFKQSCSEESMEITNSLLLCSNKPIDKRLVGCEDNLDSLWKRLTNPSYSVKLKRLLKSKNIVTVGDLASLNKVKINRLPFKDPKVKTELSSIWYNLDSLWKRLTNPSYSVKLKRLLKSKNIVTVGDLASLNEVEINRLPFKDPKVKTVRKALFHYYNSISKKSNDVEEPNSNSDTSSASSGEETDKQKDIENQDDIETGESSKALTHEDEAIEQPLSLKEELRLILTKMKQKNTSLDEFGEVLIDLVEESELINLLETVYNTNFRKFFGKPHWRYLVENIVKSGGTSELFDIISDLADTNRVFADKLEHIIQIRIDQDPLKNILKKKTLVQVSVALQDCIKHGEFQRENVIQTCFMPLIKSPSDISNYFNSLTIVQIHDLFIERVQPSDLTCFLNQIKEHYGNYTIAQCANRQDVLKICSKEELATSLIEKENEVGAVKHLISHVSDHNKLLELYNYIGSLLPLKCRIESHINVLRSIPFDKDEVE